MGRSKLTPREEALKPIIAGNIKNIQINSTKSQQICNVEREQLKVLLVITLAEKHQLILVMCKKQLTSLVLKNQILTQYIAVITISRKNNLLPKQSQTISSINQKNQGKKLLSIPLMNNQTNDYKYKKNDFILSLFFYIYQFK